MLIILLILQEEQLVMIRMPTLIIGDVIAGSSLSAGWYAYAATSTNTNTGTFRIMQVDSNNTITSLAECDSGVCQII